MKKIFSLILIIVLPFLITSCGGWGDSKPPIIKDFYYSFCDNDILNDLRERNMSSSSFQMNKWLKYTKIEFSKDDYVIGFLGDNLCDYSTNRASVKTKFIIESGLISDADVLKIKNKKNINKYSVAFVMINNELKVILFEGGWLWEYIVLDCNYDFGLTDAIEELSNKYDFDIFSDMKERSKILLDPNVSVDDLFKRISPIFVFPNYAFNEDIRKEYFFEWHVKGNLIETDADIFFHYYIRDSDSFENMQLITYEYNLPLKDDNLVEN